jgi:hypothetical protein
MEHAVALQEVAIAATPQITDRHEWASAALAQLELEDLVQMCRVGVALSP